MKKKKWPIVLACILGFVMYIGPFFLVIISLFIESIPTKFEIKDNNVYIDKGNIVIDNVTSYYSSDDNSYYVIGYAHNKSKKTYNNLALTYRLYDKDGIILGDSLGNVEELKEGKTWKFKIVYSDIDSNEVDSIEFIGVDIY